MNRSMNKKAYWISIYNEVLDADKLAAYALLAGPALTAAGGRILARGMPSALHNMERCSEQSLSNLKVLRRRRQPMKVLVTLRLWPLWTMEQCVDHIIEADY